MSRLLQNSGCHVALSQNTRGKCCHLVADTAIHSEELPVGQILPPPVVQVSVLKPERRVWAGRQLPGMASRDKLAGHGLQRGLVPRDSAQEVDAGRPVSPSGHWGSWSHG